jgi:methionyl-tRNA formyltransferase
MLSAHAFVIVLLSIFFATHRFDEHRYIRIAARTLRREIFWPIILAMWVIAITVSQGSSISIFDQRTSQSKWEKAVKRILFLGSHLQSFRCFRHLLDLTGEFKVIAAIPHQTQPPIRPDQDVRTLAQDHGIPILPLEDLGVLDFDLGISLLFDRVLPANIVTRPSSGFVNLHLGPLPRFRGANSVMHAIRLARADHVWTFGVTLHYMAAKVDTGPIIDLYECPIFEDDTAYSLYARASDSVFELFKRNIRRLIDSKDHLPSTPQQGKSYFFRKGQVEHEIDLSAPPLEIYDRIRSLTFPGKPRPFATIAGRRIFLTLDDK